LLATTTSYQTRMFTEAAQRLGVELLFATDRCDQLEDPWRDHAIAVRFHEEARSVDAIVSAIGERAVRGVLAVGDRPSVTAAHVSRRLGLRSNPPEAASAARDKRVSRERWQAAGLPVPHHFTVAADIDPASCLDRLAFPVVLKPTVLSGSRGVIRADDPASFVSAFERLRRLLASPDVRELRDPQAGFIQIEEYIPGVEFALEGVMDQGRLRTLAVFDKPEPLEGPFFEETIYVTPSRATAETLRRIEETTAAAASALTLQHGPVHAECRVNERGVYVLEVAARPIGGLCARVLRFAPHSLTSTLQDLHTSEPPALIPFEELLLRHALGEDVGDWQREPEASAVMMIPIPRSGVYRRVEGEAQARQVDGVSDVQITAKPDQQLLALPEGASYLGFIFARGTTPDHAEAAVREAHSRLTFTIDPLLPIATGRAT
jgi:hypothetical protein